MNRESIFIKDNNLHLFLIEIFSKKKEDKPVDYKVCPIIWQEVRESKHLLIDDRLIYFVAR